MHHSRQPQRDTLSPATDIKAATKQRVHLATLNHRDGNIAGPKREAGETRVASCQSYSLGAATRSNVADKLLPSSRRTKLG